MTDFFISYTHVDRSWAVWIAWQLEEAGYTTTIQAWDFKPGSDWVEKMHSATQESARTIAVLSSDYLTSVYGRAEWRVAFRNDPTGNRGLLIPVRVANVEPPGLLSTRTYIDLVDTDEQTARDALLIGLAQQRAKPSGPPKFPGHEHATVWAPVFPGPEFVESFMAVDDLDGPDADLTGEEFPTLKCANTGIRNATRIAVTAPGWTGRISRDKSGQIILPGWQRRLKIRADRELGDFEYSQAIKKGLQLLAGKVSFKFRDLTFFDSRDLTSERIQIKFLRTLEDTELAAAAASLIYNTESEMDGLLRKWYPGDFIDDYDDDED